MFDYIKDGINPRGPEYGATARAADAAQRNAEANEDLLELQLAGTDRERDRVAASIMSKRTKQVRRATWRQYADLIATALFVGVIIYVVASPTHDAPQSAVTRQAPANAQTAADDTNAPESSAQAPDDTNPAVVEQRGEDILHKAGFTDAQIQATRSK